MEDEFHYRIPVVRGWSQNILYAGLYRAENNIMLESLGIISLNQKSATQQPTPPLVPRLRLSVTTPPTRFLVPTPAITLPVPRLPVRLPVPTPPVRLSLKALNVTINRTGAAPSKFEFSREMGEIMGNDPTVIPILTIDSEGRSKRNSGYESYISLIWQIPMKAPKIREREKRLILRVIRNPRKVVVVWMRY
ncbi:hypothetical protein LOTGIDRAFT_173360 [Lottia gigantea]|uniref:Uncharacterized protein n=1 Tax=Lottia gigantea TaxID=225164 RepID=V4AYK9_LOTGI|nr:hypothetical protein LOTGIDRAFT_173360 [Lottia gigantea]ESP00201.1 hypothetical protein LOTGIDRAFT_173360 [Lottia gigantea]